VHGWAPTLAYAEPLWWDGVGCLFEFYNGASLSCLSVGQIGGACAHVHMCCGDLWIGTKLLLGGVWRFDARLLVFLCKILRILMDFMQEQ
jgi:hypothetical protein